MKPDRDPHPRELLLLRHGKSDWHTDTGQDFDRPLAPRGHRAVRRMARLIDRHDWRPDTLVSSPAVRAEQTVSGVCAELGIDPARVVFEPSIYEAEPRALVAALERIPEAPRRVLMVGHNPGFELLVRYLSESAVPTPPDGKLIPTCALARLAMPEDWRNLPRGCARLIDILRPRELDD